MTDSQRKTLLSTLWIFILFNMIYADILGMIRPGYVDFLDQVGRELSGGTVLLFAVLMEVVIIMVPLSRLLDRKASRWLHSIAVPLCILWVVVPALMPSLGSSTPLSYVFFASVEVTTMIATLVITLRWPKESTDAAIG